MGCQPGGSGNTNNTHKQIHITTKNDIYHTRQRNY
jgi:hypothetical protein